MIKKRVWCYVIQALLIALKTYIAQAGWMNNKMVAGVVPIVWEPFELNVKGGLT